MTPGSPTRVDEAVFRRVLGDELRAARKRRGLSRKDMIPHLNRQVSLQTLATYEQGTRAMPITRFVEICLVLDVSPVEILRRTWERVIDEPHRASGWDVDLAAAAQLGDADLAPLAAWAAVRLHIHGQPTITRLNRAAITHLATLCRLEWWVLVSRLPQPKPA
jgi:transcriptional regulator with XRE-family HTH domain